MTLREKKLVCFDGNMFLPSCLMADLGSSIIISPSFAGSDYSSNVTTNDRDNFGCTCYRFSCQHWKTVSSVICGHDWVGLFLRCFAHGSRSDNMHCPTTTRRSPNCIHRQSIKESNMNTPSLLNNVSVLLTQCLSPFSSTHGRTVLCLIAGHHGTK